MHVQEITVVDIRNSFVFLHEVSIAKLKMGNIRTFHLENSSVGTGRKWHYKEEVLHKAKHASTTPPPQKKPLDLSWQCLSTL
jgi:hypothetical protein